MVGRINILFEGTFASPSVEEYSWLKQLFSHWMMQTPRQG